MSGQTALQCYTLSAFRGLNLHDDDRQIEPGQFTALINASTDNGAIKADEVDAIINIPVPKILINNINRISVENPWTAKNTYATGNYFACLLTGLSEISLGQQFNGLVPFTCSALATGNNFFSFSIFNTKSSDGLPSTDCGIVYSPYVATPSATASDSTFFSNSFVILSTTANEVPGSYWAVFQGTTASGSYNSPFNSSAASASSIGNWVNLSATSATSSSRWSCLVSVSTLNGGHILNMFPIIIQSESKKISGASYGQTDSYYDYFADHLPAATSDSIPFARIYYYGEPTYKSSFCIGSKLGYVYRVNTVVASTTASIATPLIRFPDMNVIEIDVSSAVGEYTGAQGTLLSLTSPGNRNDIVLDYTENFLGYQNTSWQKKVIRKRQGGFFNGNLITIRNGQPIVHIFATEMITNAYPIKTMPLITPIFKNPKGVVVYQGGYVFYYNAYEGNSPKFGRAYFNGTPGIIDSFTAQSYENISYDQEILTAEEWYGSIIFFFADRIKRYSGTPGNAVLETIFYKGVACGEVVCKSSKGIFFVSNDGLYIYNGAFNRITDYSTKFDQANCRNVTEDGWLEFNDKTQELYFYPGYDSVVNVWNAKHDFFRQKDYTAEGVTGGMRFFKYYDNMDLKTAISYPGITHVSQVEAGTTFKPITITSGWIDVDEGQNKTNYEQKRFDRAIIEFTGKPNDGSYFNFILYFDDGTNITTNNILMAGSGIVSYPIPIKKQAKLIKYSITAPAQASQLAIQKLKFYYDLTMLR